jgi:3-keto-disaccharide hydrolase
VTRNQSGNPILIGNIYRHGNPGGMTNFDSAAALRVAKPTGEWQMLEIEVRGDFLNVTLNGTVITRASGLANPRGYIGLQGEAGTVQYRKIEIQEIP